jgi:hypothetical protein
LSVLIIKPKYGKHKLVFVGGYVVLAENVVKVRGITLNIGEPIYTVYCIMCQPTYLLTKKKGMLCVSQLLKKLTGFHGPCCEYFAIGDAPAVISLIG